MSSNNWTYDVFISYCHADAQWVWEWLVPRLKDAGLHVCTDRESFDIGVPALINMENAVAASRHTLLVLTPDWLRSQWAIFESLLVQHTDPSGLLQRTLPVMRRRCDPPSRIAMLTFANLTGEADDEADFGRVLDAIRSVRRLPDTGSSRARQSRKPVQKKRIQVTDVAIPYGELLVSRAVASPGPRLAALGFPRDPFAFLEAEKMPPEILEETFVEHPDFDRYIMDLNRSAVLLAPRGSGKTAGRLRLEVYLNNLVARNQPLGNDVSRAPLIVTYANFGRIVKDLPDVGLSDHFEPLLAAVAEAAFVFIAKHPDRFMRLNNATRDWWWALLETFLKGVQVRNRVRNYTLMKDLLPSTNRPAPFQAGSTLEDAIDGLRYQLGDLGYDSLFILVDGVDGYGETQNPSNLAALVMPLLNTLSLLSLPHVIWKFFLPESVREIVHGSAGYETRRLNLVAIHWDEPSLIRFLHRRLEWASDGQIQDIAQLCGQELLHAVDVERELVRMALRYERLGAPRALLDLGSRLFHTSALEEEQGRSLSLEDWNNFK